MKSDLEKEFNTLVGDISKNVINSTINQTLKETARKLEKKVPEIDEISKELTVSLSKHKKLVESIDMNKIEEQMVSDIESLREDISEININTSEKIKESKRQIVAFMDENHRKVMFELESMKIKTAYQQEQINKEIKQQKNESNLGIFVVITIFIILAIIFM